MSLTQSPHELHPAEAVEEEPDDFKHGRKFTWQEHLTIGDAAYAEAVELEEQAGLDAAIPSYEAASKHLIAVTATGPLLRAGTISAEAEPADPVRLLKIAGSLAKQAQVSDNEFYETHGSRHIDVKANKQRIAAETLQRASRLLLGKEAHADHTAMIAEFDVESPAEAVVMAAVEAAKETGTSEYVYGPAAIDEGTAERLEEEGKDAIVQFIGEHALESGPQGLEFVARTAEIAVEAVEEMTAEHKLPLAA